MNLDEQRRKLARGPKRGESWYRIEAKADSVEPATVYLYDEIDSFWGVAAERFVRDVAAITADEITVRINSPGGNVFDGIAIMNSLRGHKAKVTTVVDGLAASAASFIAMAGDEIVMQPHSEMMIHQAHALVLGEADDLRKMADDLDRHNASMAEIYAERAGGKAADWAEAMRAETWYTDQEAVAAGLADRIGEADAAETEKAKARFDYAVFAYAGRAKAPAPQTPTAAEAVAEEEEGLMPTLQEALRERLGITADDATEETILSALDEALAERADDSGTGDAPPAEQTPEQVTAAAARMGLTLVDRAQYEATVAAANEGQQARAQQMRESDERLVDARIQDGAVAVARRDHWLAALAADREGNTAVLNGLPKGLIPVAEVGHSVEASDDATANALYKEWKF